MIRGYIVVKASHVEEARTLAQQPPFSSSPEDAAACLVPANAVYSPDGITVETPATLYHASGLFEESFWQSIVAAANAYDWGGAWEYDMDTNPTFPQTKLATLSATESFAIR